MADEDTTTNDPEQEVSAPNEPGQDTPTEVPEGQVAQPSTPSEPRKYGGKYDTVEELEKAATEKDKLIGKQGEELGKLRGEAVSKIEDIYAPGIEIPEGVEISDEEKAGLEALQGIHSEISGLRLRADLGEMRSRFQDFDALLPSVVKILEDNPGMRGFQGNLLETAYKIAKAESLNSAVEQAKQEGKLEAYQKQEEKKTPFLGQSSRSEGGSEITLADIKKMSVDEYKKNLPKINELVAQDKLK